MPQAYIIIIGDEILNGLTLDSNSNYLAYHLNEAGLNVTAVKVINDDEAIINHTFREAKAHADVVIATGGLGPTRDDITKSTLANLYDCEVAYDEQAAEYVYEYIKQRNMKLDDRNKGHAYIPEKALPLRNKKGMAPGLLFDDDGKVTVALPGVPSEMQYLTDEQVIPFLKERLNLPPTQHKHFLTVGIREIVIHEKIQDLEDQLPPDIGLAYLPDWGMVKLRLTGRGYSETAFRETIQPFSEALHERIGEYIFGYDGQKLAEVVGNLLKQNYASVATAESCTGGYLAHLITNISGSSGYFKGSLLTYANDVKMNELGVEQEVIENHGAVSEPVVEQMVKGVNRKLGTDYAIATSGVAGPSGGSDDKPVGTVWIAAGSLDRVETHRFHFFRDRFKNIYLSSVMGLDMLRRLLIFGEVYYPRE